jgi:uncharacterized iron-regulated membrane protein
VKSKQFRDVVFIAHRYIGRVVGILAAAIGLTGSLLIIHGWTSTLFSQSSQSVSVPANGQPLMLPELILKAKALQPNLTLESLDLLKTATEAVTAWWLAPGDKFASATINPYTGTLLSVPHADGTPILKSFTTSTSPYWAGNGAAILRV